MKPIFAANLVLRFLLELAGLWAAGYWGFATFDNWPLKLLFGIGLPLVMATAWGVFRVPNDGGAPKVRVAPQVRLALEAVFFTLAVGLLAQSGQTLLALVFVALLVVNYGILHDRTWRLLTGRDL
jgi:hypothetical protein